MSARLPNALADAQRRQRGLREAARKALARYGIGDARLRSIDESLNAIYQVHVNGPGERASPDSEYEPRRFALRLHLPGYHSETSLRSELAWLAALRRDADVAVPEPVAAPDGETVLEMNVPGTNERRYCTLLTWVRGRFQRRPGPASIERWGTLMARLHNHAALWVRPAWFTRPPFLWDVDAVEGEENPDWSLLGPADRELFHGAFQHRGRIVDRLAGDSATRGLIHGDLAPTNLVVTRHEVGAIDFDCACFGYWLEDMAIALGPLRDWRTWNQVLSAFVRGYRGARRLSDIHLTYLDTFMASLAVQRVMWRFRLASGLSPFEISGMSSPPPRGWIRHTARFVAALLASH